MRKITFIESILILSLMLIILGVSVIGLGISPQMPILFFIGVLIFYGRYICRYNWDDIDSGIVDGIKVAVIPIVIFILIGALIAVWVKAGVIPSLMFWGFKLINVKFFVPSVFIVCSLVGLFIGSGMTTISTIGIATLGIGYALGINPALTCGAIISGAMFGDKMSPISDTTNLAPGVAGADLFAHIKNMIWTTAPAFIISLLLFFILGQTHSMADLREIQNMMNLLEVHFNVSVWTIVPVLLMFGSAWFKLPAIPTLFLNIVVSVVLIFLNDTTFNFFKLSNLLQSGYVSQTGNQIIDSLLSRGGIDSMMGSVFLIIMALALGGLLMRLKIIETAMNPLITKLKTPAALIFATVLVGIFMNLFIGEMYLAIILTGNAFKPIYHKLNLAPVSLSRSLEDSVTLTNYIIPWGIEGAFAANTLGVPVISFLPFAFFSFICPILSILSGITGIGLKRID